ncbi:FluG domain protein [Penicillium alfredii]|uniref:FluG domain protein n=1 Tax=Penicillium alfredii TaxID=1506179 RepID=A0A9W9FLB5_9EURO|nr:FluG domain protein [Penicillium alfredii]KAJ5102243.1 FluG domain protein [Penicillium alfredii]
MVLDYRSTTRTKLWYDARIRKVYKLLYTNITAAGHLDKYSRNVIIGYQRSGIFAYYVSVRDNTQSAFIETPARDALLKLACNSSLTRDASAP